MADLNDTETITLLSEVVTSGGSSDPEAYDEAPQWETSASNSYDGLVKSTGRGTSKDGRVEVRADLIFEFIKTHMNEAQVQDLAARAQTLGKLLARAREIGQDGFCDELRVRISQTLREQEFLVRGYGKWFSRKDFMKFRDMSNVRLELRDLHTFSRPIPAAPAALIQKLQEAKVFERLLILHMDPTGDQALSFAERIQKKDPILFGVSQYDEDRLFYITDWVDEVCDLTMDKLLTAIHEYDKDFKLSEVPEVSETELAQEMRTTEKRIVRYKSTRPGTYRGDVAITSLEDQRFSWKLAGRVLRALWHSAWKRLTHRGETMGSVGADGPQRG